METMIQQMDENIQRYCEIQRADELLKTAYHMAELPNIIDWLEMIYFNDTDLLIQTTQNSRRLDLRCAEIELYTSHEFHYRLCLHIFEDASFHRLGGQISTRLGDLALVVLLGQCRILQFQPDLQGDKYYRYRWDDLLRYEETEYLSLSQQGLLKEGSGFALAYDHRYGLESVDSPFTVLLSLQSPPLATCTHSYFPIRLDEKPTGYPTRLSEQEVYRLVARCLSKLRGGIEYGIR